MPSLSSAISPKKFPSGSEDADGAQLVPGKLPVSHGKQRDALPGSGGVFRGELEDPRAPGQVEAERTEVSCWLNYG